MKLRFTARAALLGSLLGLLVVLLLPHTPVSVHMRDLADRVSGLHIPVINRPDPNAKLAHLRWPQWRVGAGDSPDEAARRRWELARATQHAGTGARIQRFLEKAKRGEPFTVAAIGGSVSKGRGLTPPTDIDVPRLERDNEAEAEAETLGADTLYSKENLHVLVFNWLNATFPHARNRFVNGAQGGVGSGYFAWCFKEHIYEDVDLVLIELGINDLNHIDVIAKYEHLVRSVLELDSSPAMINVETFTPLFPALISSSALHGDVLAYYDVPSLSIRDILLPRILADPDTQLPRWFRTGGDVTLGDDKVREWGGVPVDLMHISARGHALAAGLIINYLSSQLAQIAPSGWSRLKPWRSRRQRVYDVPSTSLTHAFNPQDLPEKRSPVCRSMNSGRKHNRVSGTDATPDIDSERVQGLVLHESSKGWEYWAWAEKRYLVARTPGSIAVFDFVTSEGQEQERSDDDEALPDPMDVYEHDPESAPYDPEVEREGIEADEEAEAEERERESEDESASDRPSGSGLGSGTTRASRTARRQRLARGKEFRDRQKEEVQKWKWLRTDPSSRHQLRKRSATQEDEDGGTVAIGYQRSANYGLGSVFCWVDDDKAHGRRLDGYWKIKERNMGTVDAVATGLKPGKHRLQCELLADSRDPLGRKEFRLFAIMHD